MNELRSRGTHLLLAALILLPAMAEAQKDPKFNYGKAEEVKGVEWKAKSKAGLVITTGNSRTTTFTFAADVSRKSKDNKFALEGGVTYARSSVLFAEDLDSSGTINEGELRRRDDTTAESWNVKGRYDRFFTTHNSFYVAGLASADKPSGKDFATGGQAGYSRQVYKSDWHEAVAEIGYDFSYENYTGPADESATIHSARIYLGDISQLTKDTAVYGNVELLLNLNEESAPNANDPDEDTVAPFKDTRVTGRAGISTTLWERLSFSFGVTLKYDYNPAPRPQLDGAPPYADGYRPFADKLDTITEAALVFNFL